VIRRLDRLDLHRAVDGGLEQLLDAVLTQQAAKAPDLRGVTSQPRSGSSCRKSLRNHLYQLRFLGGIRWTSIKQKT